MRTLKADEIEVRVGSTNKAKTKAMLLLYKDARCDMALLDEVYGSDNWQVRYDRIGDILFCSVGIYDDERNQWVWKQSNGVESQGNDEGYNIKGEASDAFKRACFMVGIGRELYEFKNIWIDHDGEKDKYTRYSVKEIEFDNNRHPVSLVIENSKGVVVYEMRSKRKKATSKSSTDTKKNDKNGSQAKNNGSEKEKEPVVDLKVIKDRNTKHYKTLVKEGMDILNEIGYSGDELSVNVSKKTINNIITNELKLSFANIELVTEKEKLYDKKHIDVLVSDISKRLRDNLTAEYSDWGDFGDENEE